MTETEVQAQALKDICFDTGRAAVAVSGGVDSVTLAVLAHQALGKAFRAYHAVSPAVPAQATERVELYAERFGWQLEVVDAGEFDDLDYLANPHNRCYFCKKNLYHRIAEATETQVFSGANVDDLGDYRPGLIAAREKAVRHPYIEAGVTKANVRDLARMLGLEEVQDLPAMPCLSSRIESGIPINADDLAFVNDIELRLRTQLPAETVRCRIVAQGVRVELGKRALGLMLSDAHTAERDWVEQQCHGSGRTFVGFDTYLRGSAFKVPLTA